MNPPSHCRVTVACVDTVMKTDRIRSVMLHTLRICQSGPPYNRLPGRCNIRRGRRPNIQPPSSCSSSAGDSVRCGSIVPWWCHLIRTVQLPNSSLLLSLVSGPPGSAPVRAYPHRILQLRLTRRSNLLSSTAFHSSFAVDIHPVAAPVALLSHVRADRSLAGGTVRTASHSHPTRPPIWLSGSLQLRSAGEPLEPAVRGSSLTTSVQRFGSVRFGGAVQRFIRPAVLSSWSDRLQVSHPTDANRSETFERMMQIRHEVSRFAHLQ
jgi:hypothetical protein